MNGVEALEYSGVGRGIYAPEVQYFLLKIRKTELAMAPCSGLWQCSVFSEVLKQSKTS